MLSIFELTIASGAALSGAFPAFGSFVQLGLVYVPAQWTAANIGFVVSTTESGTYVPLCDEYGARVKITNVSTATAKAYKIPLSVAGTHWLKLASLDTADDSAENQAAARTLYVTTTN